MDPAGLRRLAGRWRVPLGTVEKEHAIVVSLGVIQGLPCSEDMVLKGGTALRAAYFPNYRFSEDVDFTALRDVSSDLLAAADRFRRAAEGAHVALDAIEQVLGSSATSRELRIRYRDMNEHRNSIWIQLSLRERPLLVPERRKIHDPYKVLPRGTEVRVMALPEILAEKIRALHTRSQARDLYDTWRLLRAGTGFEPRLVDTKLRWRDRGLGFDPDLIGRRIARIEAVWERDLRALLPQLPPFGKVAREVRHRLGLRRK